MLKIISSFLFLGILILSSEGYAGDNLTLSKYTQPAKVPDLFLALGGGQSMTSRTYKDDDNNVRTDKVYYTTTHSYKSTYKASDIAKLVNPSFGKTESLFEETQITKSAKTGFFDVVMDISTPFKNFSCASNLNFKNFKEGNKNVFIFSFSNFNMIFTDMVIKVEVEEQNSGTKVMVYQIAAMKGSAYKKLDSYFAIGKFEKAMKQNIRRFQSGIGGI